MKCLVTGASGFVGTALCVRLAEHGHTVAAVCRRPESIRESKQLSVAVIPGLEPHLDWKPYLQEVDAVVHLAARVHQMRDNAVDPLQAFRATNVQATARLAEQSADAGVKRFVYISSIKVNGEQTPPGHLFTAEDVPAPADPYAVSKHEAEQGLRRLSAESGMDTVIIRPPLVYGPGVKANFLNMIRWLDKGIPLPLGAIHNRRSLVALDNLVDLIEVCLLNPAASNNTFLVSDGEDISTTELLTRIGRTLGKPARLIPVSERLIRAVASLLGPQKISQRLLGSLQVDIRKNRDVLGWTPPVGMQECLRRTVEFYRRNPVD